MDDADDAIQREIEERCKAKLALPEHALLPFSTGNPEPISRKPLSPLDANNPKSPTLDGMLKHSRPNARQLSRKNLTFYTALRFLSFSGIILIIGLVIWWIVASAIILNARLFAPPGATNKITLSDFIPMPIRAVTPETVSSTQLREWLEQQTDQLRLADAPLFVLYPLNPQPPTQECTHVSADMLNSVRIGDVKRSLLHHLSNSDYDFLCAQHLGMPLCYCIAHLQSHIEGPGINNNNNSTALIIPTQPESLYVNMFNMNILGYSRNMIMANNELSLFCKEPLVVRRYEHIWAEFTNADQSKHEREFRGSVAYNLQQMFELQHAMPVCADNFDAVTSLIKQHHD